MFRENSFSGFVDLLLPSGGYLMALHAYFDESARESGVFCVSGYVFESIQAKKFDKEWRALFGSRLPFHMVDLISGRERFKGLSQKDRDTLLRRAVEIINRRMTLGVATCCNTRDFDAIAPRWAVELAHPYSVCAHFCMGLASHWLQEHQDKRRVAYVFESGHKHQPKADRLFRSATHHNQFLALYHYQSHTFALQDVATPLQAADVLAWEWAQYCDGTHSTRKRLMRQSLLALGHVNRYALLMIDRPRLERFYRGWRERADQITAEEALTELSRVLFMSDTPRVDFG